MRVAARITGEQLGKREPEIVVSGGVALPHFAWIVMASTGVWRVAGRTP